VPSSRRVTTPLLMLPLLILPLLPSLRAAAPSS
jgi:hypothetical protein